jgi:hypothetical protein
MLAYTRLRHKGWQERNGVSVRQLVRGRDNNGEGRLACNGKVCPHCSIRHGLDREKLAQIPSLST